MPPIPITIVTGFLGSGKTMLILNLVPQLRAANPDYRLALLKNEFGDLAVDSQLAASGAVAGVRELLNGCICCNLVGQLGDALRELAATAAPDRVVVETSGSAFPATLALEINRLARETAGAFVLDGVVSVLDVENWQGYADTSYTARLQARYTDLVVFNKWEACDERRFDTCLDRLADLYGAAADVAWVKSRRGRVDAGLVFGLDRGLLARALARDGDAALAFAEEKKGEAHDHAHDHGHGHDNDKDHRHQSEVDVLSVTLRSTTPATATVDVPSLLRLLRSAPKEEVYRIKAVLSVAAAATEGAQQQQQPLLQNSDDSIAVAAGAETGEEPHGEKGSSAAAPSRYILNWAFGRWTFTPVAPGLQEHPSSGGGGSSGGADDKGDEAGAAALRMTVILAPYEGSKWAKKLQTGGFLALAGAGDDSGTLAVTKIA